MKKIILSMVLAISTIFVSAQSAAGTYEYKGAMKAAAVAEFPYTPSRVNDAMDDYLSKKGKSKVRDPKGFDVYRNTSYTATGDTMSSDLYFHVERKSRKDKDVSVINLLLESPVPPAAGSPVVKSLTMEEAMLLLDDLGVAVGGFSLEQEIRDQNEILRRAESKLTGLISDGDDYQKKRDALDKKLAENVTDKRDQEDVIVREKARLADLTSRRK